MDPKNFRASATPVSEIGEALQIPQNCVNQHILALFGTILVT